MMKDEGLFPRMLELIQAQKEDDADPGFLRLMLNLLYEMARIQRLKVEDLGE